MTKGRPSRPVPSQYTSSETDTLNKISVQPKSDVVVREFEQDEQDKKIFRRIDPTSEITTEMAEVRAQMEKLERELAAMKQGPFGPQSQFMSSLPQDERTQLLQALADEGVVLGGEEDVLTMAELERLTEQDEQEELSPQRRLAVTLRIPRKDQAYVRHFNKVLRAAQEGDGDVQKSLVLWTWYLRCQQQMQNFSTIISASVWEILWNSQAALKARPKHLVMLAKDMLKAEEQLTPGQWLAYIEALNTSGDTATAVNVWSEQKTILQPDPKYSTSFYTLGVKLFSTLGRPLRAQEIAFTAINQHHADPKILIPVIIAWAKSRGPEGLVKSWACYLKLRDKLGDNITPDVFEEISTAFLNADCADMALSVFKDMLLMREQSSFDSRAIYSQATKHFAEILQKSTTEEHINRVGLSALLILPRQFHNRFFFASWVKKLIGEGRTDAAAMVVELMYERGVVPDAKPLNGIIGAWLREGSTASQRKAEKMAWAMINAREEIVKNHAAPVAGDLFRRVLPPGDPGHARRPVFLQRQIPPATIETFSIMLLHHTRRSNLAEAERITDKLTKDCKMKPNAFIMNHWLYMDLRASRLQELWDKYRDLKHEISPDLETYAVLWDTAKVQLSRSQSAHAKYFPSARQLFAEMIGWTNGLTSKKLSQAGADFSAGMYEQIIRCFSLSTDLPGTLVAMHGLHQMFGMLPDDNSIRLICGQAARFLPSHQKGRMRGGDARARRSLSRHGNVLVQVADIVETIEAQTKLDLVEREGEDPRALQDPTSDISRQLRLVVMTRFMCMFMQKMQSTTGSYRNEINIAATSMKIDLSSVDLGVSVDV